LKFDVLAFDYAALTRVSAGNYEHSSNHTATKGHKGSHQSVAPPPFFPRFCDSRKPQLHTACVSKPQGIMVDTTDVRAERTVGIPLNVCCDEVWWGHHRCLWAGVASCAVRCSSRRAWRTNSNAKNVGRGGFRGLSITTHAPVLSEVS
jgi:hypothetical protein